MRIFLSDSNSHHSVSLYLVVHTLHTLHTSTSSSSTYSSLVHTASSALIGPARKDASFTLHKVRNGDSQRLNIYFRLTVSVIPKKKKNRKSSKQKYGPCTTAAAAAAKSLQSCPTLCHSRDGSPPGSPVPGILQARTLEWVAIFCSNA